MSPSTWCSFCYSTRTKDGFLCLATKEISTLHIYDTSCTAWVAVNILNFQFATDFWIIIIIIVFIILFIIHFLLYYIFIYLVYLVVFYIEVYILYIYYAHYLFISLHELYTLNNSILWSFNTLYIPYLCTYLF